MTTPVRILLVEDDLFLRKACEASLTDRGFDVTTAVDGEAALRLVLSERYSIVLLDLLMPKMSGIEVLRALRANADTQSLPVLILSNSSRAEDREAADALGAAGYFVKANLSLRELGDRVEALVGGTPPNA
ncbi:MAG: response regulator [Acidobacteria bacterium]|nr:response regulator [Acidobacteriota bacterium]